MFRHSNTPAPSKRCVLEQDALTAYRTGLSHKLVAPAHNKKTSKSITSAKLVNEKYSMLNLFFFALNHRIVGTG